MQTILVEENEFLIRGVALIEYKCVSRLLKLNSSLSVENQS